MDAKAGAGDDRIGQTQIDGQLRQTRHETRDPKQA
jgi:hypothetical protein